MTKTVNEEIRPIIIKDAERGAEYTLEFSRESVMFAERHGFDLNDLDRFPMTKIPEFFFYAFRKNHPNVARERTDKMIFDENIGWGGIDNIPEGLIERLGQLYVKPFQSLKDASAKNSNLTVEM